MVISSNLKLRRAGRKQAGGYCGRATCLLRNYSRVGSETERAGCCPRGQRSEITQDRLDSLTHGCSPELLLLGIGVSFFWKVQVIWWCLVWFVFLHAVGIRQALENEDFWKAGPYSSGLSCVSDYFHVWFAVSSLLAYQL